LNTLLVESWSDILGYEGLYQISDFGEVKSLKRFAPNPIHGQILKRERLLKGFPDTYGHIQISLYKDGKESKKYVHKLVAYYFMGHETDGTTEKVIDHIDEDKSNNRKDNLQIISHKENISKHFKLKKGENIKKI
jgi:hypothetical protein